MSDSVLERMMIAELKATSPASLRAVFCLGKRRQIRIELDIDLIGGNDRSENRWAEIANDHGWHHR